MCRDVKPIGSSCLKDFECGYSADCFEDPDSYVKTCKRLFSLPNGSKIKNSRVSNSYYLCESSHSEKYLSEEYCMPPPVSDKNIEIGLNFGEKCPYWEFKNPWNISQWTLGLNPPNAQCGFNQDSFFYCPI